MDYNILKIYIFAVRYGFYLKQTDGKILAIEPRPSKHEITWFVGNYRIILGEVS